MVTLFYRLLPSGHRRAYLDYYVAGKRHRDKLPVILRAGDKLANAEKKRLAEAMRADLAAAPPRNASVQDLVALRQKNLDAAAGVA